MAETIMWRGKNIDDMTRDELLAVIREMAPIVRDQFSPYMIRANALGRVEMLKRGIDREGDDAR